MPEAPILRVTMSRPAFKALLQRGVGIPDGSGASVREFLQGTLGIDAAYVEEKLQTVFLDGHPVDDFDRAVVRPGAVLALSGAMPGLAGATMRRGGFYARMREGITHAGTDTPEGSGERGRRRQAVQPAARGPRRNPGGPPVAGARRRPGRPGSGGR